MIKTFENFNEEEWWYFPTIEITTEWFNNASESEINRFIIGFNDGQGDHGFYTYNGIIKLLSNSDRNPELKELKGMTRTEIVNEFYQELDLNGNNSDMTYFDGNKYLKVHWK